MGPSGSGSMSVTNADTADPKGPLKDPLLLGYAIPGLGDGVGDGLNGSHRPSRLGLHSEETMELTKPARFPAADGGSAVGMR